MPAVVKKISFLFIFLSLLRSRHHCCNQRSPSEAVEESRVTDSNFRGFRKIQAFRV